VVAGPEGPGVRRLMSSSGLMHYCIQRDTDVRLLLSIIPSLFLIPEQIQKPVLIKLKKIPPVQLFF
jgi:hypothetical protein